MQQAQHTITEHRVHTNESLDAERATTDSSAHQSEVAEQRELDDLIERDRILADARLVKLRISADDLLALDRSASPSKAGDSIDQERRIADQGRRDERDGIDAHMRGERRRSDLLTDTERKRQEHFRAQLEARRQNTDVQLSTERYDSDAVFAALSRSEDALALSEAQQVRYGDVLGIVTHDLRSPLASIAMSAEAIAEETQEPTTRKLAHLMTQAAARMDRLTTDLIDVVRIQSGALRITKRSQDLADLLAEVQKTYGPLFTSRGLTFTIDISTRPIVASFDYDRIVQVLSNLLGNAMKFTPRGGRITLQVRQHSGRVEFSLSDNGPGIAPSDLPHIFERFWQIDNQSRRGLGLGLYICKTIVEAHGGKITAESELGKGTTIRFSLS